MPSDPAGGETRQFESGSLRAGCAGADSHRMDPINAAALGQNFQIQVAVARKAMDTDKAEGDAMVELIKQAAAITDSTNGTRGDGSLDVYA